MTVDTARQGNNLPARGGARIWRGASRASMTLGAAMALATLLSACTPPQDARLADGDHADELPTGTWTLAVAQIDGEPLALLPDWPVTIEFEGDQAGGVGPCNSYGVEVALDGGRLTVGDAFSNAMHCGDEPIAIETAYLGALARVSSIDVSDALTLSGDGVILEFAPTPVIDVDSFTDQSWVLVELFDRAWAGAPETDRLLTLWMTKDGGLIADAGCGSTLTGAWMVVNERVVLTESRLEGDCPDELVEQQARIVSVLGDGFTAVLEADGTLRLGTSGGFGLRYATVERPSVTPPAVELPTPSPTATS